jgi:hypothetical protein
MSKCYTCGNGFYARYCETCKYSISVRGETIIFIGLELFINDVYYMVYFHEDFMKIRKFDYKNSLVIEGSWIDKLDLINVRISCIEIVTKLLTLKEFL